ncbi:MAG: CRISPR-associated helicase Cas3', partial [candidate division WOR-3 bacterium]|nr:CRISPR-associated helicase Cas3' [candidate division WOR-3 bacterium]
MLIAKSQEHPSKSGKRVFQTLEGHTFDCLTILRGYLERNKNSLAEFCKRWGVDLEHFQRNLFITIALHDIGKATKEFQRNIRSGKFTPHQPHAFYAYLIFYTLYKKEILKFLIPEVDIEACSVLGHHTQLHNQIYMHKVEKAALLKEEILGFLDQIPRFHKEQGFDELFSLEWRHLEEITDVKHQKLQDYILRNVASQEPLDGNKERLKAIYARFHSILQLCDDYASAHFAKWVVEHNPPTGEENAVGKTLNDPGPYISILHPVEQSKIMGGNDPYEFQQKMWESAQPYQAMLAPCGRGKTEAAIMWAFQIAKKHNRKKIIFAMPTQITSNAMRDRIRKRVCDNVGIFHGKSRLYLKDELSKNKTQQDESDRPEGAFGEVWQENFKGNVFFHPITVTTIDHLILSFAHGFSQADFALGNLQDAVIVFDEVHYYEHKTLEHLYTLFGILKDMEIPYLLMSGTLPNFLIDSVQKQNPELSAPLEDKEGLKFEPFKIEHHEEHLVKVKDEEWVNEEVLSQILEGYGQGLRQFVIVNTIDRAKAVYQALRDKLEIDAGSIILHHSEFTYEDRLAKEREIKARRDDRPFILIATQIIEISLDISCDRMFTELVPVDALGQRGGRLHRKGKSWKEDGREYVMHIYEPENPRPYEKEETEDGLLARTRKLLKEGATSYRTLSKYCDEVYKGRKLSTTNLINCMDDATLFGPGWWEIARDDEEGKALQIRSGDFQHVPVIPWDCYQGEKNNLTAENIVQIPLWRIQKYRKDHPDGRPCFDTVLKKQGCREEEYRICY